MVAVGEGPNIFGDVESIASFESVEQQAHIRYKSLLFTMPAVMVVAGLVAILASSYFVDFHMYLLGEILYSRP